MTSVPFTAFHPVPVWLLWKRFPARLDFVALTVGAIIPDLLEPLFLLGLIVEEWSHRDWTHSLLGALTFDAVLGLAATALVARPLLTWADRRWPSGLWSHFAGHSFRTPKSWPIVVGSVWIGSLSHVLVDLPFHPSFRLLSPAVEGSVFHWTLEPLASFVSNIVLGPLFAYVLYAYWWLPVRRRQKEAGHGVE